MLKNLPCPWGFLWPAKLLWNFLHFFFWQIESHKRHTDRVRKWQQSKKCPGRTTSSRRNYWFGEILTVLNPRSCNFLSAVYCCHGRWSPDLILQSFEISTSGPCEGLPYKKIYGLIPQASIHILIACPSSSFAFQWDELQVWNYQSVCICRLRT